MAAQRFAAYAGEVSRQLQTLLDATDVELQPAVTLVACGARRCEHYVPAESAERHQWKCHGEKRPPPVVNAGFYYGHRAIQSLLEESPADSTCHPVGVEGTEDIGELRSLMEPDSSDTGGDAGEGGGIAEAISKAATSAGEFYAKVHSWKRIPRTFAAIKDGERALVTPSPLRRWLRAELSRPGMLPDGGELDEELVEYVTGLLEHPDFCQPDLLVLELHEFLDSRSTGFVLALWKFLVVEIGLNSVFRAEKRTTKNNIQAQLPVNNLENRVQGPTEKAPALASTADAVAARDYKRRRVSYRKKVGTKTGKEAFREMIHKHMIGLSIEADQDLVLGSGFEDELERDKDPQPSQSHPEATNWYRFSDALDVRNRGRPGRSGCSSRERRRSRSRSRARQVGREDDRHVVAR